VACSALGSGDDDLCFVLLHINRTTTLRATVLSPLHVNTSHPHHSPTRHIAYPLVHRTSPVSNTGQRAFNAPMNSPFALSSTSGCLSSNPIHTSTKNKCLTLAHELPMCGTQLMNCKSPMSTHSTLSPQNIFPLTSRSHPTSTSIRSTEGNSSNFFKQWLFVWSRPIP